MLMRPYSPALLVSTSIPLVMLMRPYFPTLLVSTSSLIPHICMFLLVYNVLVDENFMMLQPLHGIKTSLGTPRVNVTIIAFTHIFFSLIVSPQLHSNSLH